MRASLHLRNMEYVRCPPAHLLRLTKLEREQAGARLRVIKLCRWQEIKLELAGLVEEGDVLSRTAASTTHPYAADETQGEDFNVAFILIFIVAAVIATALVTICYKRFGLDRQKTYCCKDDEAFTESAESRENLHQNNRFDEESDLNPPRYSELSIRLPPKYESSARGSLSSGNSDASSFLKTLGGRAVAALPPPYREPCAS